MLGKMTLTLILKAADFDNILEHHKLQIFQNISSNIIVVRNKKNYIFSIFYFENRQFAFLQSGYSFYTYNSCTALLTQ